MGCSVSAILLMYFLTDCSSVHVRFKLKKVSHRCRGAHHLPAAVTLHHYARLSQSRQAATASPISMQALRRLALHLLAKALRTRPAEDALALYLHDSLRLALAMVLVARSHRLVPRVRRTLHQAACMAQPHQLMLNSKLRRALPTPAARRYFRD